VTTLADETTSTLARLRRAGHHPGIVSVYLNTRWADEHQRDRTRLFLAHELARARQAGVADPGDLDWIEEEGRALVEQAAATDAHGVALFAGRAAGIREKIRSRIPFTERFEVADRPDLADVVALLDEHAPALVVFVDGESARLIPVGPSGTGEEVVLAHDVPGQHRRGGWAQLAQGRYARHIESSRDRHFEAVAAAVTELAEAEGIRRIVLAGQEERLAAFRRHLPERLLRLVVGDVRADRRDAATAIVERARQRLGDAEHEEEAADLERALTEARKGGRAVAGPGTLDAARRGAIHRLYVLADLRRPGRECDRCGVLQEGGGPCAECGGPTRETDLAARLVDRVVATGGSVEVVPAHPGLAAAGGYAARLRYAP
jgi:peptide subunit release factor 1 (eRF1)